MKRNSIYYLGYVVCMLAATLALWGLCACSVESTTEASPQVYALVSEVVELDKANGTVTVEDYNGNLWAFAGVEDWEKGDACAMAMNDKGTESIYDDEIVNVNYQGWKISE